MFDVCMYVCMYAHTYVYMYVYMYADNHLHIYVGSARSSTLLRLHALHSIKVATLAAPQLHSSKVAQTVDMLEASAYVGSARTATLAAPALY